MATRAFGPWTVREGGRAEDPRCKHASVRGAKDKQLFPPTIGLPSTAPSVLGRRSGPLCATLMRKK